MERLRRIGISFAALLVLTACATGPEPEYGARYDPLERFPQTAIWVWDEAANVLPEGERFEKLDLGRGLEEMIGQALAERGYQQGTDAAHYRVSYQLGIATRIRPEESVATGSLSVLISTAASRRPVWLGFARAEIDATRSDAERQERLRAIVNELLSQFPPGRDD